MPAQFLLLLAQQDTVEGWFPGTREEEDLGLL